MDDLDTNGAAARLARLADDLDRVREDDLDPFVREVEHTVDTLGDTITRSLETAARSGRLSVEGMVDDILAELARLAADKLVRAPIEGLLGGGAKAALGSGLPAPTADPLGRSGAQIAGALTEALGRARRNG